MPKLSMVSLLKRCKSSRAFRVEPGFGLSLSKSFGPILGLDIIFFNNIQSNDFFVRGVDLLCSPL